MVSCVLARVGGLQSAPISNMRSINVSCVCVCVCVCVCACVRACVFISVYSVLSMHSFPIVMCSHVSVC